MEWIRGNMLFPKKVMNVIIDSDTLEKYNLSWAKPPTLTDEAYCNFLEGLFLYLKENDLIPKDSQLWAAGRRWETMGIYLTVSSEEFKPVIEGALIPCIRLDLLLRKG